jgi:hypothetical protein
MGQRKQSHKRNNTYGRKGHFIHEKFLSRGFGALFTEEMFLFSDALFGGERLTWIRKSDNFASIEAIEK